MSEFNPFESGFYEGRILFPWETAPGEGFIAPWTPREATTQGFVQSGREMVGWEDEWIASFAYTPGSGINGGVLPTVPAYTPTPAPMPFSAPTPAPMPFSAPTPAPMPSIAPLLNGSSAITPQYLDTITRPEVLPVDTRTFSGAQPTHGDVTFGKLGTIIDGIPISGPGVPEPPHQLVAKHWHWQVESKKYGAFYMFYWKLIDGRMMSYHSPTKTWKIWRPKKHIVISSNPRIKMLAKLNRLNKRVEKMLKPYQPKQKGLSAKALAQTYLSTAERKLLK